MKCSRFSLRSRFLRDTLEVVCFFFSNSLPMPIQFFFSYNYYSIYCLSTYLQLRPTLAIIKCFSVIFLFKLVATKTLRIAFRRLSRWKLLSRNNNNNNLGQYLHVYVTCKRCLKPMYAVRNPRCFEITRRKSVHRCRLRLDWIRFRADLFSVIKYTTTMQLLKYLLFPPPPRRVENDFYTYIHEFKRYPEKVYVNSETILVIAQYQCCHNHRCV